MAETSNNENQDRSTSSHCHYTVSNSSLEQDNPLHLHSSDNPGMKLVNDPFDGSGFSNWKRSMIIALSARNKLGFVDGSLTCPEIGSNSHKSWQRCNDMVISWILGALSKTLGRSVIYCNSAHQIWLELEERYGVSSGAQLFGLQKELNEISQGNNNIADFFTKIKMLWDDIDALGLIPTCTCGCKCGASHKMSKFQQDQRVIQFLMGLNDSYAMMRGSILMKSPLPSISQVYCLLLQEESQREIHSSGHFMSDSASLNANTSRFTRSPSTAGQFPKRTGFDPKKSSLHCNYCKKTGHTIDKCYKIHGFPPDFKFTKSNRIVANVDASNTSENAAPSQIVNNSSVPAVPANSGNSNLSPELCSQLINMLKSVQMDDTPSAANFAGLFSEEATGNW
ncbi:uncharacterized protein LOC141679087 [Apium graveolens]|uniref:uncharacterized protein LOC141679087 n=1 Tax=Apium graveolens TaxID=4045 RepID=UPI003D790340